MRLFEPLVFPTQPSSPSGQPCRLFNILALWLSSLTSSKAQTRMASADAEKNDAGATHAHEVPAGVTSFAREESGGGDIQVLANASVLANVKTTPDGKIILLPQPSGMFSA